MNALVWLLIPVAVTCFAAWWINQRAEAAERDNPDALSPAELAKMKQALERDPNQGKATSATNEGAEQ